jgi:pilus assembly protein Flp/PilA
MACNEERSDGENELEQNERGASMVEYALLVALIALIAIAAVRFLGNSVSGQFSSMGSRLSPG